MSNLARRSALALDALNARDGATLYRYTGSSPIALKASKPLADGTVVVTGIDVLKIGTYKGLSLGTFELETMAARFTDLRDGGVFLPPFRLDHSFSVMSVIGWFEELYVEPDVDATTGETIPFLRGDVRFTGSLDYTPEQILRAIKAGALRNRSSELGPYVTNQGAELPLVFYGCAFVDVPAVEGLAPIALSRHRHAGPAAVTELSEGDTVDPSAETTEPTAAAEEHVAEVDLEEEGDENVPPVVPASPPLEPGEATALEAEAARQDLDAHDDEEPATVTAQEIADAEIVDLTGEDDAPADEEPVDGEPQTPEGEDGEEEPAAPETPAEEPSATLRATGGDELARLRAENLRLRTEQTTRDLEAFSARGVIVPLNRPAALALLSHDDDTVRESARVLLEGVPTLEGLATVHGRQQLSAALSAATGNTQSSDGEPGHIALGMSPDEVGVLWASLSTEQRAERQAELEAWEKARRDAAAL